MAQRRSSGKGAQGRDEPGAARGAMASGSALLTTEEVAALLHVHPKHVYRLLRKGLPARRVGSEWRFERAEVMAWSRPGSGLPGSPERREPRSPSAETGMATLLAPSPPPLIAANGDRVVGTLLRLLRDAGCVLGLVESDKESGLRLLAAASVLATGSHAGGFPTHVAGERVARIHLVTREVGLVARGRVPAVRSLASARVASRPASAGIREHFDAALAAEGLDPREVHAHARLCASHLEVACVVSRGTADVGVASRAWAEELGLAFRPLAREAYGLIVRARDLGDPSVVRICEMAQGERFRTEIAAIAGYDPTGAGDIKYDAA